MTSRELAGLVLSHHRDDQVERCIVVRGHHICRRCTVFYPIALLVMGLVLAGLVPPIGVTVALMLTLPIPVTVEFLGEQCGRLLYNARRQVVVTALGAPALGFGFARALTDRTDPWFWLMVALFAAPCVAVSVVQAQRRQRIDRAAHIANESRRPAMQEFESAEEFQAYLDAAEYGSPNREREMLTEVPVTRQELACSSGRITDDEAVEWVTCP